MLANNGLRVKAMRLDHRQGRVSVPAALRRHVATLAAGTLTRASGSLEETRVGPAWEDGTTVRRFVRVTARLVLTAAVIGGVVRVGRTILGRPSPSGPGDPIRTGSLDSWPAVPVAPGRDRSGT
jgi:hypothetical protein